MRSTRGSRQRLRGTLPIRAPIPIQPAQFRRPIEAALCTGEPIQDLIENLIRIRAQSRSTDPRPTIRDPRPSDGSGSLPPSPRKDMAVTTSMSVSDMQISRPARGLQAARNTNLAGTELSIRLEHPVPPAAKKGSCATTPTVPDKTPL